MRDGLRRPNIYLVEAVLEKIRYNGRKAKFEEIFMKDFPESKKDMHTQNEELHQVPQNRIYRKKSTLRHWNYRQSGRKILNANQMWRQSIHQIMTFRLTAVTEIRASGIVPSKCWEVITVTLEFYIQLNSF